MSLILSHKGKSLTQNQYLWGNTHRKLANCQFVPVLLQNLIHYFKSEIENGFWGLSISIPPGWPCGIISLLNYILVFNTYTTRYNKILYNPFCKYFQLYQQRIIWTINVRYLVGISGYIAYGPNKSIKAVSKWKREEKT